MCKESCSTWLSRAVNGAVLEVSGKNHNLGLGGFAREQGLDVFSLHDRRRAMSSEMLSRMTEFLGASRSLQGQG